MSAGQVVAIHRVVTVVRRYFRHLLTSRKSLVRGQAIDEITLSGPLIDLSRGIGQPGMSSAEITRTH